MQKRYIKYTKKSCGRLLKTVAAFIFLTVSTAGMAQTGITSLSEITDPTGNYRITDDIDSSGFTGIASFSGTLEAAIDTNTNTLTGTVKNLVIEGVSINTTDDKNTGAIARTANGSARIYNVGVLGGSVGGTGYTGGLVGLLDGTARVINCYSYAKITGGSFVGGIVGFNNVATASDNLKTMVMNCMFYGNITGGDSIAAIYNGKNISNAGNKGVGNYNYFWLEAPFVQPKGVNFNSALGAEKRFLNRFEFFRHLLNGHRELAGWWATGTYGKSEMLKWVLLPDSIGTAHPYPVLMEHGTPRKTNLATKAASWGR